MAGLNSDRAMPTHILARCTLHFSELAKQLSGTCADPFQSISPITSNSRLAYIVYTYLKMSAVRGMLKIGVGAVGFYFLVMRHLDTMGDWYNERWANSTATYLCCHMMTL